VPEKAPIRDPSKALLPATAGIPAPGSPHTEVRSAALVHESGFPVHNYALPILEFRRRGERVDSEARYRPGHPPWPNRADAALEASRRRPRRL